MSLKSYIPTVLLVDDDEAATRYWRKKFQTITRVGVVEANDMRQAKLLIDDPEIEFDAVLSDLYFEPETDAPELNLFTGIDLLEYSQLKRPNALRYTLSYFAETPAYRHQAEERGLSIQLWFQKSFYSNDGSDIPIPWERVSADLLDIHLKSRTLELTGDLAKVVPRMDLLTRTYLQDLNDDLYTIKRPIEVICRRDCLNGIDVYSAAAQSLGLLQDGDGDSIEEALCHLGELIVAQQKVFDEEPDEVFVGFASLVKKRLNEHIARRD